MGESGNDGGDGFFPQTRWSLIAVVKGGDEKLARRALGEVCEAYWRPLYAFARHSGKSAEEAEDLVQGFFEVLISRSAMERVDAAKGKLRSFLMASFKKFMTSQWRHESAQKRGGGVVPVSIDAGVAEGEYLKDSRSGLTPEEMFDRRWALTLLERVMERLGESYEARGQGERFEVLKEFLEPGAGDGGYASAAEGIGMKENAFQQAVFRMRAKYRELLEAEIAETVGSREAVQEELRELIAAV